MIETIIIFSLMIFMMVTALALIKIRNLFAVVMLCSIYSLLGALVYLVMDAVDVAFTEAAVGAGIATVLMLGTLALTTAEEKVHKKVRKIPILTVVFTGGILIYGTLDMPYYGEPTAPIHHYVSTRYLNNSANEVGPPNVVTSVLASYRGYDTLGETFVIFTAATGVLAIIGRAPIQRRQKKPDDSKTQRNHA